MADSDTGERPRLVVGISGASGALYGVRVLEALVELGVDSHLIVTRAAGLTLASETGVTPEQLSAKATTVHRLADVETCLPAVIGAGGAMSQIPDGATVEVDPVAGTVRVLS